jgi:glycosyltransferase A (GT-A) superfamily protein (DUF2064 family)
LIQEELTVETAGEVSTYEVPASLSAFGATPRRARVFVRVPTPGQRLTRAAKALGTFWAVAAGCIFLPVLHFVLVPTFAAIGLVMGAARLRDQQTVTRVHGGCPRCGREQDFAFGNRLAATWRLDCPACHTNLQLIVHGVTTPTA